jgi:hypothetical protein
MKDERLLVVWQCEKCGVTRTAFLAVGESTERGICGSNYIKGNKQYPLRIRRNGDVVPYACKGKMVVIVDERPEAIK